MTTVPSQGRHELAALSGVSTRAARGARTWIARAAPVAVLVVIATVLRVWDFQEVGANPFYDAAVRSMGESWHNLWFGALEPGGRVAIDKPPADLWLQVAAVALLGHARWVTRVPEVIAGIVAVPVLYDLVRRIAGTAAGLGSAAALAVMPVAVLTAHSDTMDSLMMLLNVVAAWLIVRAAETGRGWRIVAAGAAVGLAFNVKLFEALIALPALAVLATMLAPGAPLQRVRTLALATAAMVCVGLSWVAAASLTPLRDRPWPFGSPDGSVWGSVFGYDGIDRITEPASRAALHDDPAGPLRLLSPGGHDYRGLVGTALAAALLLGALALRRGLRDGRLAWHPAQGIDARVQRAGIVAFGTWMLTAAALLSEMQRLQPRYLEALAPAIAAVIGIGAARLTDRRPHATAALLALALALPGAQAIAVAAAHRSDAGLPSRLTPTQIASATAFLARHDAGAHDEILAPSAMRAAPLIAAAGRPALILTNAGGHPLVSARHLAALVAEGQVRYGLLGPAACSTAPNGHCAAAVRWALRHSRDVSAAAGLAPQSLWRLESRAVPRAFREPIPSPSAAVDAFVRTRFRASARAAG